MCFKFFSWKIIFSLSLRCVYECVRCAVRLSCVTVKPRLSQHLLIECLPLIANTEELPLLRHQPDHWLSAHARQRVVSRTFAVYHNFKSEGYSRLSLRVTWPLLLLIGGVGGGMVEFIVINGRDKLQLTSVAINGVLL